MADSGSSGEPRFTVRTACTLSQYMDYNRTVQRKVVKLPLRLATVSASWAALGAIISVICHSVYPLLFLGSYAVISFVLAVKGSRKAELMQYQQEQLAGTVVYEFHDDRMVTSSYNGTATIPYSQVTMLIERPMAWYLIFKGNVGAILPKEDCPDGLFPFLSKIVAP